jgi:hypothetical protein
MSFGLRKHREAAEPQSAQQLGEDIFQYGLYTVLSVDGGGLVGDAQGTSSASD